MKKRLISDSVNKNMTKKTRLIILAACTIVFFIITPYIVLYSLGYRVDIKKLRVFATGGIYIKALPQGAVIAIDSKINNATSFFSPTVFEQNLLPGAHAIYIKKDGYYDYQKNLIVTENEVTKLEHVSLIKQHIPFVLLEDTANNFYISPNEKQALLVKNSNQKIGFETVNLATGQKQNLPANITITGNPSTSLRTRKISDVTWSGDSNKALINAQGNYFLLEPFLSPPKITPLPLLYGLKQVSFNPQNPDQIFYTKTKNLYVSGQITPVIKSVVAYQVSNNTITYLSYDGFMYTADMAGNIKSQINSTAFPMNSNNLYKVLGNLPVLSLKENDTIFLLNKNSGSFENFYSPATNVLASPDGQKILYQNDREMLYSLTSLPFDKVFLNRFSEKISDIYWLGSDYIVFTLGGHVVISEIDIRGNINMVTLPATVSLDNGSQLNIENPKIYFNQQDKKLYVLTKTNLIVSDKLIP